MKSQHPHLFMTISLAVLACLALGGVCQKPPEEFLEPVNVSNNSGCSEDVSMAVDSRGTVHLAWTDNTPGLEQGYRWNQEILHACKPQGETWSSPVNVSHNDWPSRFPCLQADREDRLHLVWQDASPLGDWSIFYAWKLPNTEWSVPETIAGPGGEDYTVPSIAVDRALDVHLVWQAGPYYVRIWYASRNPATGWSAPVAILPRPSSVNFPLAIACDRQGGIHVAWSGCETLHAPVYVNHSYKTPGGGWLPWETVSDTSPALWPIVAVDLQDNAHFVWYGYYREHVQRDLAYRVRYADGTWSEVMPCTTITDIRPYMPSLAVGPDDRLHFVWIDYLARWCTEVLCYSSKAGPTWADRKALVKCLGNYPAVGVGPQGEVHVAYNVYVDVTTDNTDIFYLQVKE